MRALKFICSFVVFWASWQEARSQEYFFYYQGRPQPLRLNTEYAYVVTSEEVTDSSQLGKALGEEASVIRFSEDNTAQTLRPVSQTDPKREHWAEIQLRSKRSDAEYVDYLRKLKEGGFLKVVSPYFQNQRASKIGLSHYFYVKLKSNEDFPVLAKMAGESNVLIVGQNKFMPLWYTLKCTDQSPSNALENANRFYESGLFTHAEPDLMTDDAIHAANDPEYVNQWGLANTGQYGGTVGTDVRAEDAWQITKGSREVVVAVLDHGFEMNHPDLQGNTFGTGFDSESGTSPALVLGSHGTACAGIIGAIQDNHTGVSGVAPNVRLMSVSNSLAGSPASRQKRADGINWAWLNGAHVISNSWSSAVPYAIIDDAITNAFTSGRGGLGTLVVFAAGNDNGGVSYPANSHADIVAVGAMSQCAERKSPTSCDGEGWGSNFGAQLDVVAPGVFISTTDRQGANGYTGTDYTSFFNGTSSACPMVAGVAALVLSVNPCLTHDQVEDILEQSAQKAGTYAYAASVGRPNGTWHNEMGYGLVDAEAAVQLAQGLLPATASFDLFSKDRPFDIGTEPNPDGGPMWISEDIWVRNNLDGGTTHQNPEFKLLSPNGVYVKITNRGRTASACANLAVYFSKASTGLVWPTHWEDYYQGTSAGSILHGDKINTVFIPALAPGASHTIEMPWYPPDPADFDSDVHHFCLLTRIESPADPMFDEPTLVGVGENVRKNNNIAWKNVSVYDTDADAGEGTSVFVRGVQRGWSRINLRFFDGGFQERIRARFFERGGTVRLTVDPELMNRLKEAQLDGVKMLDDRTLLIASPKARISNLPVHSKETFSIALNLKVLLYEKEELLLDVVQENAQSGKFEGGERF
ncbi:MAG: S8 family serine peptidase, partial [Ferruginibacter sp.]|nr:S8 family serine peptidase [Cytophagales bacterium]